MAGRSQQGNAWQEIFKHIIKAEVIHTKIWAAVPQCCTIVANFTIKNSKHLTCWAWFDIFTDGGFKEKKHLKPQNLVTLILLSILKMPIKAATSHQAKTKYLEEAKLFFDF